MTTSYAILGTGALGGLYGARLASAGLDVHFLLRSDYDFVRRHGLQVSSPWGDLHLNDLACYQTAAQLPKVDVAIVAWKTTGNAALADTLEHVCGPETIVLVLQNGYDVEQDAAQLVGEDRVLGGCCFLCCNKVGPGTIHHLDYGKIVFGEYSKALAGKVTARMQAIEKDFRSAGIPIEAHIDLQLVRWRKLMWNIPFNGLSVVLNANTHEIMQDVAACQLAGELMHDVRRAAESCGSRIDPSFADKMLEDTRKMVPYDSSMLLDYRHQRPIEVEAIFGNAIRAAEKNGYSPPQVRTLYNQLRFLDKRNRPQRPGV